ncbi:MAG: DUF1292 domain-containing protein [Deltaproteobacteria bacterium]|nr:MAG: DUF1292 domain-containing protein [Deltaproteobacteria bacterium]
MSENTEEIEETDVVILVDDEGNETEFAILLVVEYEGQDYAALSPVSQIEDDSLEEQEIFLFVFDESVDADGELTQTFDPIEDEETFNKVSAFCQSQFALLMEQSEG